MLIHFVSLKYLIILIVLFSTSKAFSEDDISSKNIFYKEVKNNYEYRVRQGKYFIRNGDYKIAVKILESVLYRNNGDINLDALMPLMKAHWYLGNDINVISLSDYLPAKDEARVWYCRVLERKGTYNKAYSCWNSISEVTRSRRVIRSELIEEIFNE